MTQIARYETNEGIRWGVVKGDQLSPLSEAYQTTRALLRDGRDDIAAAEAAEPSVKLAAVRLLSPITRNQQVVCQGANYREHMRESGMNPDDKGFNMLFRKASSCLAGANDAILRPSHVGLLDYEVELGLVLGEDIDAPRTFTGSALPDVVAALVVHNDVSARDVQVPQMQFYKGKSYRTFGPTGPWLTLVDDRLRSAWGKLELRTTVNGQERQRDVASEMVFGPAATLTEVTHLQSLNAGDLIATGTPSGVAMSVPKPALVKVAGLLPEATKWKVFLKRQHDTGRFLNDGDVVETSIRMPDGSVDLGALRNRVERASF